MGGAWAPIPQERHPRWYGQSAYAQGLGLMLGVAQHGKKPPGLHVEADWKESLCRVLQIRGPERPNVKRALQSLFEARLLVVEGGLARVLLSVAEVENYHPVEHSDPTPVALWSHSDPTPVPFSSELSAENDSVPISQIRSEEIRSERETRAREGTPPIETPARGGWVDDDALTPHRIGHDFLVSVGLWNPGVIRTHTEYIGSRPEAERRAALGVLQRDSVWVKENATARHVVTNWESAYGRGRTPVEGKAKSVAKSGPEHSSYLERMRAQHQAIRQRCRELRRSDPEGTELFNLELKESELALKIARAEQAAA